MFRSLFSAIYNLSEFYVFAHVFYVINILSTLIEARAALHSHYYIAVIGVKTIPVMLLVHGEPRRGAPGSHQGTDRHCAPQEGRSTSG